MTYSYTKYEFTAFTEADLLQSGDHNLSCGDSFVMPATATTCIEVCDNDIFMSGDSYCNENANDQSGQTVEIDGQALSGQIYAECYIALQGSDGKMYYLIEMEVENHNAPGAGDDYFTFYGAVPPEGTQLTVEYKCNVTGNWVDYKCLDAGDKVEYGSISGTVFCDTDCDGINGSTEIEEGCDYTIEAEDMHMLNYQVVHGANASGGELVKLTDCWGDLWTDFHGKEGTYDVKIFVQDENDGQSLVRIKVNGVLVDAIRLDGDTDGGGSNNGGFSTFVIKDVELSPGDEIMIWSDANGGEYVRIDKLEFEGKDKEVVVEEPTKAGVVIKLIDADGNVVDQTETDADGNYSFDQVPVGDYKIMGVAPDGTEFTIQDAGSDDSIDSDVDGNGMSGLVSVTADGNVDIDLGVCEKKFVPCDDPNAVKIDFEGFLAGTVIDDEYASVGVTIEAQRKTNNTAENDAMVFDSNNPTGGDSDLATTSQGNILIVSEDNDSSDPDDAIGGTVTFTFDNPSYIFDIKAVDTEEGGMITLKDEDGNVIATIDIPSIGDGDIQQVIIDTDGVASMEVMLNGSGAIDDLCFVPGEPPAPATIGGRYFCDENNNSVDDGEPGIEGATVWLLKDGVVIRSTTTDANGDYCFEDVEAGDGYSVRFEDPADIAGQEDKRFVDADAGTDDEIDSDVTSVGGAGNGNTDSFSVAEGEEKKNVDAGIEEQPGSLSGRYFCDTDNDNDDNGNGGEPAVAGKTVTLYNADGSLATDYDGNAIAPAVTDANGEYSFDNLAAGDYYVVFEGDDDKRFVDQDAGASDASDSDVDGSGQSNTVTVNAGEETTDLDAGIEELPGSLSGRYFCDTDNDNDDNSNGGEPAVAGKTVTLYNADGSLATDYDGNAIAPAITDANGEYSFDNLAAGDYYGVFEGDEGKRFVDQNAGASDASDSDVNDAGRSDTVTVNAGEETTDLDAGIEELPGALSGRYFCDTDDDNDDNGNGGEPAVAGALVALFFANGVAATDYDGNPIAPVETDANGEYLFDNLAAGDYYVVFQNPSEFDPDKSFVDQDSGASDASDSDVDANGQSNTVAVVAGETTTDVDAGIEENNTPPTPVNDDGMVCVGQSTTIDLLDNDSDPDGDTLTVTEISDADETAGVGETITLASGATATLNADGTVSIDATDALPDLLIGDEASDEFDYVVSDGAATGTANVDLTLKGAKNTIETICEDLPDTVTFSIANVGEVNEYQITFVDDPTTDADDALASAVWGGFCIEEDAGLVLQPLVQTANVYGPCDDLPDGVVQFEENLDNINWVLNQDFANQTNSLGEDITFKDVQDAIWGLSDGRAAENLSQQEIIDAALTAGEGFVAGEGDLIGIVLDPTGVVGIDIGDADIQTFIVAVPWETLEEECVCPDDGGIFA